MKLYDLLINVKIESNYKVVYYDYEAERLAEIDPEEYEAYEDQFVFYMYVEDGILYIQIHNV